MAAVGDLLVEYLEPLLILLLVLNIFSFLLTGLDKLLAVCQLYRVPEVVLLTAGVLLGGVGLLLAMLVFWHKVRKIHFKVGAGVGVVITVAALVTLLVLYMQNKSKDKDLKVYLS